MLRSFLNLTYLLFGILLLQSEVSIKERTNFYPLVNMVEEDLRSEEENRCADRMVEEYKEESDELFYNESSLDSIYKNQLKKPSLFFNPFPHKSMTLYFLNSPFRGPPC